MKFKITNAFWLPQVNILTLKCLNCNYSLNQRADEKFIKCPTCGQTGNLIEVTFYNPGQPPVVQPGETSDLRSE